MGSLANRITYAALLAVGCTSSEATQETKTIQQDRGYRGDGTSQIETEQEAVEVALWFLRGRGFLAEDLKVVATAFEDGASWIVGVQEPGDKHPVGSGNVVEINRSGFFIRVVPSM